MKRRIGMICSVWHGDYVKGLLQGIRKRMNEDDVELHIFASYAIFGNDLFQEKEHEVFLLPNAEDYDGFILANNTDVNMKTVSEMIAEYHRKGKKVLSIEQSLAGVPCAGVDNYDEFYRIVDHILTTHNCKTLNYLGGAADNAENMERFRAFSDCLHNHGISVEPERVMHKRFLQVDGEEAYQQWKECGLHLPDAVICANDNMALGYCNAATQDGHSVPDDFLLTGFDNFDEGQYFCPSITSVNRDWVQLGYDSMDNILALIEGRQVPMKIQTKGRLAINESCGCGCNTRDIRSDFKKVYAEKKQEEILELQQRLSRQELSISSNLSDMQQKLAEVYDRLGIDDMALCLNASLFEKEQTGNKNGYDDILYVAKRSSYTKMPLEKATDVANLKLEVKNGNNIYIFSTLHMDKDTYGYTVAPYVDDYMKNNLHRALMDSVALSLVNIKQRENLGRLNAKLQQLYVQDQMTGLYNRFGYMNQAEMYLQKYDGDVHLFYMDMDNLKMMNDKYGHTMGDKAIQGMAYAIRKSFDADSVCVRMGGDEFLVIDHCETEEDVLQKENTMKDFLEIYSKRYKLPFPIRASIGHIATAHSKEPLEVLVKKADAKMYEVKQKRKKLES